MDPAAAPPVGFAFGADVSNHDQWSPWKEEDPSIEITMGEQSTGAGAGYSWTSDGGPGTLTIREVQANRLVANDLDFGDRGQAIGYWTFSGDGIHRTRATWGIMGESSGLLGRLMVPLMGRLIGPSFDRGLANLKKVAESPPPEPTPEPENPEAPDPGDDEGVEAPAGSQPEAEAEGTEAAE